MPTTLSPIRNAAKKKVPDHLTPFLRHKPEYHDRFGFNEDIDKNNLGVLPKGTSGTVVEWGSIGVIPYGDGHIFQKFNFDPNIPAGDLSTTTHDPFAGEATQMVYQIHRGVVAYWTAKTQDASPKTYLIQYGGKP